MNLAMEKGLKMNQILGDRSCRFFRLINLCLLPMALALGGCSEQAFLPEGGEHSSLNADTGVFDQQRDQSTGSKAFEKAGVFIEPILGYYVLVADDDHVPYTSVDDWQPVLYDYQKSGANTLFLTFVNPMTMDIPPAFDRLIETRGSQQPGSVPDGTHIIYSVGGQAYSHKYNPWPWLSSQMAAEDMAARVAAWKADGIDLDIEDGAGNQPDAGRNLIHFVRKLRELRPDFLITLPVYGFPQIRATNELVNAAFDAVGQDQGLLSAISIMVYEGVQSLNYVKNYANATDQWEGFPIKVNVPREKIFVGLKGTASRTDLDQVSIQVREGSIGGIIVWYASVKDAQSNTTAIQYSPSWDASVLQSSIWSDALNSW